MRRVPTVLTILLLAVASAGCGTGDTGADEASSGPDAIVARLGEEQLADFGCGHAFTVGTADQTIRLSLWSDATYGEAPEEGTEDLGGRWTGELVTGRDLFAQWCDDVIGPDEPEVVEEASWDVDGTLRWELLEGDGQCPSVAIGTLTDAEVVSDDGAVALPRLEFRNEHFGCLAG